ncbi:hypothetical protein [Natrialba swarupiae]|uniref:Uncharacterized protein n=1 Tax=Natrialba swarupiae TaxID=2448032 RepID=A0A5D5AL79_9EURY|nr:hypothetical protein [Natrialba swarupiae]TYT60502.1 hypothetical protein FYC77_18415 [Natrialba swarupiae]
MGERKFTFIELHLDGDTQFGPREIGEALPFGEEAEPPELETETDDEEEASVADDAGSAGKAIGAVVALAVLVAIAAAARKFGGDDEPDLEEEDQPDVIVN